MAAGGGSTPGTGGADHLEISVPEQAVERVASLWGVFLAVDRFDCAAGFCAQSWTTSKI